MKQGIGIIGFGNMGSAIAERIKSGFKVIVFDKDKTKTAGLSGLKAAEGILDLVNRVDAVLLAVKPQDFDAVLNEIKSAVKDKLVISIAAGITTAYIENLLGRVKVVRVMPNIGARIGEAESSLCKGSNAKDGDLDFAKELFGYIGKTWVMEERMIDAATAISGSGPAYIYYDMEINKIDPGNVPEETENKYIELLSKAAERVGFDPLTAMELASSTTSSSLHLAATGVAPSELRKQVTSKGGTTEAAIKVLAAGGSWEEAAQAAKKRAQELSKKE